MTRRSTSLLCFDNRSTRRTLPSTPLQPSIPTIPRERCPLTGSRNEKSSKLPERLSFQPRRDNQITTLCSNLQLDATIAGMNSSSARCWGTGEAQNTSELACGAPSKVEAFETAETCSHHAFPRCDFCIKSACCSAFSDLFREILPAAPQRELVRLCFGRLVTQHRFFQDLAMFSGEVPVFCRQFCRLPGLSQSFGVLEIWLNSERNLAQTLANRFVV